MLNPFLREENERAPPDRVMRSLGVARSGRPVGAPRSA